MSLYFKPISVYAFSILFIQSTFATELLENSRLVNAIDFKVSTTEGSIEYIKGEYATGVPFSKDYDRTWIEKFRIVQVGGVNDADITPNVLKEKGVLKSKYHIAYDWMPAFYYYTSGGNRAFVQQLLTEKTRTTLNPQGPFVHCKRNAYTWCKDYYYNYFDVDTLNLRVENLVSDLREKAYNGVFFDWASSKFLSEPENKMMYDFVITHYSQQSYREQVQKFYTALHNRGVFIVTNQAFRDDMLLASVDYDMTESYITTVEKFQESMQIDGKNVKGTDITRYYPIYANSQTIDDSLSFLNLLDSYKKKYEKDGFKNFIYMNYLAPKYIKIASKKYKTVKPKNAIYYGYAMGKLTASIVYGEVQQNRVLERDEIYFYNLGKPLGKTYQKLTALHGYIRFFEKGFVLVSSAYKTKKFIKVFSKFLPKKDKVYDAYNKKWLVNSDEGVVIELNFEKNIFTQKSLPLGRVFLY